MASLKGRIARLEQRIPDRQPSDCPECGFGRDRWPMVFLAEESDPLPFRCDEHGRCCGCGRTPKVYVGVDWSNR